MKIYNNRLYIETAHIPLLPAPVEYTHAVFTNSILKVAERLTATVSLPSEAVRTFVGSRGVSIGRLRGLCVGCEVDLDARVPHVSLLADSEERLAAAVVLVEKWVRQQQVQQKQACETPQCVIDRAIERFCFVAQVMMLRQERHRPRKRLWCIIRLPFQPYPLCGEGWGEREQGVFQFS